MSALTRALSVALVDFLWQGTLVGLLLWVALVALRNRSANVRYAVSCVALFALAMLPLVTIFALSIRATEIQMFAGSTVAGPRAATSMPQTMLPIWLVSDSPRIAWLTTMQMWALPIWSAGVLLFSVRLARGCMHAFALGRGMASADGLVLSTVAALVSRMQINRPVRVLESSLTDGPSVVGWLRPIILLPPAAAMGLTPEQLEAVLAHEMAHIKRCDYFVNMLQVVAETLFFYHPVIWWTSKQICIERELCCDDVAVRSCGDAVCYARALTTLARQRLTTPTLTMAATGGSLVYRIQRLLGVPRREYGPTRLPAVLALCVCLAMVVVNLDWLQAFAGTQTSDHQPQFEVASIKPNNRDDRQIMIHSQGGRFTAYGTSLAELIRSAYQIQEFQIVGGPRWIQSDRFDIVAKEEPNAADSSATSGGPTRQQLMLRALLAERFNMTVHKETREMPVYALITARRDRTLGPELRPSAIDCTAAAAGERGGNASPPRARAAERPSCGTSVGIGRVIAGDRTMAQVATALSQLTNTGSSLNRLVVDRTGLEGNFDVDLHFTPEHVPNFGPGGPPPGTPPIDPDGPSIFAAVQEQLGLKLDPQRGPVEVLVIDRVERPTED